MAVIGANAIFAYNRFFDFQKVASKVIYGFEDLFGLSPQAFNFIQALAGLALTWLILWVMYRRKIFFKI